MLRQPLQAAGFLSILVLPALLALGMHTGHQWLAVIALFIISPLLRMVAGDVRGEPPMWREKLSIFLHALPAIYAAEFFIALAYCAWQLYQTAPLQPGKWFAFLASLWATLLAATVPAHELLHRPNPLSQRLGRWVAGVAGYPILGHEHAGHHKGYASRTEWPLVQENVYAYSVRQLGVSLKNVFDRDRIFRARKGGGIFRGGLFEATLATFFTASIFTLAAGWKGFAMYAAIVLMVFFCMQLLAYIQHWGLGEDDTTGAPRAAKQPFGWEDACQVQAWLTLNLAFHDAHHRAPHVPFYRLALSPNAPRLPAGYVVMMVAALVPPLWRRMMLPALHRWQCCPAQPLSAGRALMCVNLTSLEHHSSHNDRRAPLPDQAWEPPPTNQG